MENICREQSEFFASIRRGTNLRKICVTRNFALCAISARHSFMFRGGVLAAARLSLPPPSRPLLSLPLPSLLHSRPYTSHAGGKVDDVTQPSPPLHHVSHGSTQSYASTTSPPPSTHTPPRHTEYIQDRNSDLKQYSHLFANPRVKDIIDRMVRVDQAGEFGAAKMYLFSSLAYPLINTHPSSISILLC
jgi:hypothetical protein